MRKVKEVKEGEEVTERLPHSPEQQQAGNGQNIKHINIEVSIRQEETTGENLRPGISVGWVVEKSIRRPAPKQGSISTSSRN
jgi:hypothetical protein